MITRARVHKVVSDTEVVLEIPLYELIYRDGYESMPNELPIAKIASPPGCSPKYKVGDVVFVCIENDSLSNPVVVGSLVGDRRSSSTSDMALDSLAVKVNTNLSEDTSIGEVTKDNIKCLLGLGENVQKKFDDNSAQELQLLDFMTKTMNKYFNWS